MSIPPIKLADGSLVYPDGRVVQSGGVPTTPRSGSIVTVPTNREAQQLVITARKKLADLPDVPRTMNPISIVLCYSLYGLDDTEIALATGLGESQIANIKGNEAYTSMHDSVVQSVIAAESGDVRDLFVKHSRSAADTMVDVMQRGKTSDRMRAAADILDRGGFRPADVVEHRHQLDGGLTIEIVRKDETRIPVIDLEVLEDV